jgi:hypothetical protein
VQFHCTARGILASWDRIDGRLSPLSLSRFHTSNDSKFLKSLLKVEKRDFIVNQSTQAIYYLQYLID